MIVKGESFKRLENTQYAINRSLERLREVLNHSKEKDIYMETGNLLLWILTADEWLRKNDSKYVSRRDVDSHGILLKGLRHAYNLVKHDTKCIQLHTENFEPMFRFPFDDTFEMGLITFIWADNDEYEGHIGQKKVFNERMKGKDILNVFEEILPYLNNEFQKYQS